jgi:DNA-binding beta-propeller fold protein YncE
VVAIDSENHGIVAERALPAAPQALALDPLTRRLYVGQMGTGMILALDADTLALEGQVALEGLGYPRDLALDVTTGRLYVAHALSPKYGAISAIDLADMSVVATVWGDRERPLSGADAVSVDGKRGVALLGYADGLVALDATSLEVLDTARVLRGGWAGALAIDRLEGTAYLAEDRGPLWTWRLVASENGVWP